MKATSRIDDGVGRVAHRATGLNCRTLRSIPNRHISWRASLLTRKGAGLGVKSSVRSTSYCKMEFPRNLNACRPFEHLGYVNAGAPVIQVPNNRTNYYRPTEYPNLPGWSPTTLSHTARYLCEIARRVPVHVVRDKVMVCISV